LEGQRGPALPAAGPVDGRHTVARRLSPRRRSEECEALDAQTGVRSTSRAPRPTVVLERADAGSSGFTLALR